MTLVKASSLWLTNPVLPRVFSWVSWPLVVFLCPAGARRLPERWLLGAAGLLHCCFCPAGGEVQAPCLWLFRHGTGRIYTQTQRFLFSTSAWAALRRLQGFCLRCSRFPGHGSSSGQGPAGPLPIPSWRIAFLPVRPLLLQLRRAPAFWFCRSSPCFPQQFFLTRSTSRIAVENMHLGNGFHGKCLSGLIYIVACPLKLD